MARNIILETAVNHAFVGCRIAFVMDAGMSGRREYYPEYKNNRVLTTDRPLALVVSLNGSLLEDKMFDWRGSPVRIDGYEADDIMIGLAREQLKRGGASFIFSNDGDILQAVEPGITVLRPRKFPDPPEVYDDDVVVEKYGFPPKLITHYKALQGDQADNIPQIPRIGHGTACKLIAQYGSVQGVIRAAIEGRLTPVINNNILNNRDNIYLNLRLVTAVEIPNISLVYEGIMAAPPSIV